MLALAESCAPTVAPETLLAVVQVESRFNPYAIGVNKAARLQRQPATKDEAIRTAGALLAAGRNIDLGLGQINSGNLGWLGLSVADAFDPCKNLAASARVLTENYAAAARRDPSEQSALRVALSLYNTGDQARGFRNGYVAKVERAAGVVPALLGPAGQGGSPPDAPPAPPEPPAPAWDVFARLQSAPVLVFGASADCTPLKQGSPTC